MSIFFKYVFILILKSNFIYKNNIIDKAIFGSKVFIYKITKINNDSIYNINLTNKEIYVFNLFPATTPAIPLLSGLEAFKATIGSPTDALNHGSERSKSVLNVLETLFSDNCSS